MYSGSMKVSKLHAPAKRAREQPEQAFAPAGKDTLPLRITRHSLTQSDRLNEAHRILWAALEGIGTSATHILGESFSTVARYASGNTSQRLGSHPVRKV